MKKILFVLITIIILSFVVSSIAEPFQFRNGISFGMTIEEIIPIEEKNGITIEKNTYGNYIASNCTVAGFDNCTIYYGFDDDNKLNRVHYIWDFTLSIKNDKKKYNALVSEYEEEYSNIYRSIVSSLENKYEKTGYIENGRLKYLDFYNGDGPLNIYNHNSIFYINRDYGKSEVLGFSQFLTSDNDNFVSIDAGFLHYLCSSFIGDVYSADGRVSVEYSSRTKELVEEQINNMNRIDNEL